MKRFFSWFLVFTMVTNPVYSWDRVTEEKKLRTLNQSLANLNYKEVLQRGLKEAKEKKHVDQISKALAMVAKRPEIGAIKVMESIDSMSYFFLNHLEKDFIGFPQTYAFYKGFRSIFRGESLASYNKNCVYNRENAIPFKLGDFLDGKINCGRPINYPHRMSSSQVAQLMEKNLTLMDRIVQNEESFERGKNLAQEIRGFFILDANALSDRAKKAINIASMTALALGAALVIVGLFATPVAGIGIPVIAGGVALAAAGLVGITGTGIKASIDRRRNRSNR